MPNTPHYFKQDLQDEGLKIPMGVYPGVTHVNVFGHNPAVGSGTTEEVWDGSAANTVAGFDLILVAN